MRHTLPATITVLGLIALAGVARAEAPESDRPISTSSSATDPRLAETARQIGDYLKTTPVADDELVAERGPRRVHGAVSVAVGTGGYRSVAMHSDIPLGETGMVSIGVEQSRFGHRR